MEFYDNGELKVTGSESYVKDEYTPLEAINMMNKTANKFGGLKNS